jgi:hypothetical protein
MEFTKFVTGSTGSMVKFKSMFFLFLVLQIPVAAQEVNKDVYSKAIEDNSFLIEEAYNQEDRVVQHISNGTYSLNSSHNFVYTFTQEWPLFSEKHQLSYTLGFSSLNAASNRGFNDMELNYRYQLTGHDDFITLAPRFSVILPTGNSKNGLGFGVSGYQFNLPASKRISNGLAVHANIGYTLVPSVKVTDINNNSVIYNYSVFNMGASAIWLVTYRTNLMLEVLQNYIHGLNGAYVGQTIISPGVRHAIDLGSLQIVPGIAVPVIFQNNRSTAGIFFYLSFEHPF